MRIETTRWLWLAVLAVGLARPAAADDAAPVAAAAPARGTYRLAILDMPAPRERAQAARAVVAAVREAVRADARVELVPAALVRQAQVVWGGRDVLVLTEEDGIGSGLDGTSAEMSRTQACAIGHAAGAQRLLLVDGYELELGQVSGGAETRLAATLTVINIGSCKVRERAVVRAAGTGASVEAALASGRTALAKAAHEQLQGLLPLHSEVRAVSPDGGAMAHGTRDGVRPGQYFDVRREAGVVGHVYVDDVAADSAEVSLVGGVSRLRAGDRLVERAPVRVFEVAVSAAPNVLDRVDADGVIRVATAMHLTTYRPVGSNMYGLSVERLGAADFTRWRIGVDLGRQVRIVPRRLFAYARVGAGVLLARQGLRVTPDYESFSGGGKLRGLELTGTIGARYVLSDALVVHLGASMPVPLYKNTWYYEWHPLIAVRPEDLIYTRPYRLLPTVSLALGCTF